MAFISVTRLRLRSWRFLPGFAVHAVGSFAQLRRATGFRRGSFLADRKLTFWTLTAWNGVDDMRAYMTTGSHRSAMPRLAGWCDQASVVHWDQDQATLPSWPEAERRMRAEGRPSKVSRPSPGHQDLAFDPARAAPANLVTPARR